MQNTCGSNSTLNLIRMHPLSLYWEDFIWRNHHILTACRVLAQPYTTLPGPFTSQRCSDLLHYLDDVLVLQDVVAAHLLRAVLH